MIRNGRMAAWASRVGRGFTLIEVMVVVALIAILATIAIPSYMKYIRRAKTIEATSNIRKLFESSVAYYYSEHANQTQQILARQFPDSQAETPAINSCCGQPGDKCNPALAVDAWRTPTWAALNFAMTDPFYFWYRYDSQGTDSAANFSAWAFGNLDCDPNYSTFMRGGHIDQLNRVVSGGEGIFSVNETE